MSDPDKDNEPQAKQDTGEQADSEQPQAVSSITVDNDGEKSPSKRGRGRPKGSKNKPREGATAVAPPTPEGPKRKRGRPPKEKPAATVPQEETDEQPAAKRPRGRPRKNPPPAAADASVQQASAATAGDAEAAELPKDDVSAKTGDAEGEPDVEAGVAAAAPASTGSTGKKRGRPPKSTS